MKREKKKKEKTAPSSIPIETIFFSTAQLAPMPLLHRAQRSSRSKLTAQHLRLQAGAPVLRLAAAARTHQLQGQKNEEKNPAQVHRTQSLTGGSATRAPPPPSQRPDPPPVASPAWWIPAAIGMEREGEGAGELGG